MNQEQDNFNIQGNNGIPNNQTPNNQNFIQNPINSQSFSTLNNTNEQTNQPNIQILNIQQSSNIINQQSTVNTTIPPSNQTSNNSNLDNFNNKLNTNEPNNLFDNQKNNKKKIIIFIIIGIILLIATILLVLNLSNDSNKSKKAYDKFSTGIIKIDKDSKYGFIDDEGNIIIDCIYDTATDFYGDYAIVKKNQTTEENIGDYSYTNTVTKYNLINKKGEIILTSESDNYSYEQYQRLDNYNRWIFDGKLYDDKLNQLSPDNVILLPSNLYKEHYDYIYWKSADDSNKVGIISIDGKITYTDINRGNNSSYNFDISIKKTNLKEEYCSINYYEGGYKANIVNCKTGKIVLDFVDGEFFAAEGNIFSKNLYADGKTLEEYYYIEDDKILFHIGPAEGAGIYYNDKGFLSIREDKNHETYYYDLKTKKKSTTEPQTQNDAETNDNIYDMSLDLMDMWEEYTGYSLSKCDSGVGLTKKNKEIVKCNWDEIKFLNLELYKYLESKGKSYIYVYKDSKWHLYDIKKAKIILNMDNGSITESNVSPIVYFKTNGKKKILNLLTLNSIDIDLYDEINIYSGYFIVKSNSKQNYYNNNFKLIYTKE